jgi:NAD(P)-dependent dehydrogenase (short-subunit alcohol dehydrogenase family)
LEWQVMDEDPGKRSGTLVIGAGGGIGGAMVERWAADPAVGRVWAVSRTPGRFADRGARVVELQADHSEDGIAATVETVLADGAGLSRVVIALGTLHSSAFEPEKSLDALRADALAEVYRVNCILPLLWVAGLGRALRRSPDTRIAVLSARVGSIGDNGLGGWYAYRSAKAALNMGLKSAAIELGRRARGIKLLAYHPGTVNTALSAPFQKNVPAGKLFSPAFTADCLDGLLSQHAPDGELSFVAWDGQTIPW